MSHLASPESVEREKWRRLMNWFKLYCKMKPKIGKSSQFIVHGRVRTDHCGNQSEQFSKGERRRSPYIPVYGTLWKTFERAGIETIKKILKNILQNPHEEKFRRLKISGKVFRFVFRGATRFLTEIQSLNRNSLKYSVKNYCQPKGQFLFYMIWDFKNQECLIFITGRILFFLI